MAYVAIPQKRLRVKAVGDLMETVADVSTFGNNCHANNVNSDKGLVANHDDDASSLTLELSSEGMHFEYLQV